MPPAHAGVITLHGPMRFWLGVVIMVVGMGLHLPVFIAAQAQGVALSQLSMGMAMPMGMAMIGLGFVGAAWGLAPWRLRWPLKASYQKAAVITSALDHVPFARAHRQLLAVLVVALIVDMMKPATLGFVIPGTMEEYGLSRAQVAVLPLAGLLGTTVGSLIWGFLGDVIGRRPAILLAGLMFIATAVCGTMPDFAWNVAMCFIMGLAAGGMLPIAFALVAELFPRRQRGWLAVLLGGVGTVGGYLAASGAAALLEPNFGWRVLWLLGLPTGLVLLVLNRSIPESPRFLASQGRADEAQAVLARFGVSGRAVTSTVAGTSPALTQPGRGLWQRPHRYLTLGLMLSGLAWGLVNFGFLLWLPSYLRTIALHSDGADLILAQSAVIAFPGVLLVTALYHHWSAKKTLVLCHGLIALSLLGFAGLDFLASDRMWVTGLLVLLLTSISGMIAVLLPYSAEVFPLTARATGTGFVAGSTKAGGVAGLSLALAALVPSLSGAAMAAVLPLIASAAILGRFGPETRGRGLEAIESLIKTSRPFKRRIKHGGH